MVGAVADTVLPRMPVTVATVLLPTVVTDRSPVTMPNVPGGPCGPVGPVGPAGPVGPGAPGGPLRSVTTSGPHVELQLIVLANCDSSLDESDIPAVRTLYVDD